MNKLFIFFVILNISIINCTTVTFNNNVISQCTEATPCDLSSRSVWVNNELPTNGDDVVIDLSGVYGPKAYFSAQSFHVSLNSMKFIGQAITFSTVLTIQNSNLTIVNEFVIQNSNVQIFETDDEVYAENLGSIQLLNGANLTIPSGLSLLFSSSQASNGTVNIIDNKYVSVFSNVNQPSLNVVSSGNFTLDNSTINYISMTDKNTELSVFGASVISSLNVTAPITIFNTASLSVSNGTANVIDCQGSLGVFDLLYVNVINVDAYAKLYGYGQVIANINSLGTVQLNYYSSITNSIELSQSTSELVVSGSSLLVQGNLTTTFAPTIVFNSPDYNSIYPSIKVKGATSLEYNTNIHITLNHLYLPINGDSILLIAADEAYQNMLAVNPSLVKVSTDSGSLSDNIKFTIQNRNGELKAVFQIKASNNKSVIIGASIGAGTVLIILVIVIVFVIKKRKSNKYSQIN